MKCPICEKDDLEYMDDNELVCQNCGSAFGLEYVGMYEEGGNERHDDGFEPEDFSKKYEEKINKFKFGEI